MPDRNALPAGLGFQPCPHPLDGIIAGYHIHIQLKEVLNAVLIDKGNVTAQICVPVHGLSRRLLAVHKGKGPAVQQEHLPARKFFGLPRFEVVKTLQNVLRRVLSHRKLIAVGSG